MGLAKHDLKPWFWLVLFSLVRWKSARTYMNVRGEILDSDMFPNLACFLFPELHVQHATTTSLVYLYPQQDGADTNFNPLCA